LIAANAGADAAITAARPRAAASDQRKMPRFTPSAVARAALRPCNKAFFVTSAMSTPGVTTTIAETSRNGSTCTAEIITP